MIKTDELHKGKLKIYRDTDAFSYGTDSVLLSFFAGMKKYGHSCDLCTGTGIIPFLMSYGNNSEFLCVDIDEKAVDLCRKGIEINGLSSRMKTLCSDVKDIPKILPYGKFDLVTANPPYFSDGAGADASGRKKEARSEKLCGIKDVCAGAKHLLRGGGRLCVVFPSERLSELFSAMKENGFEPKRLWTVASKREKKPYIVLVEAKKGAAPGLEIENIFIYEDNGEYTPLLKKIYKKAE